MNRFLADELRRARVDSGVTWRALSSATGHSTSVLHNWFNGVRSPTVRDIRVVADVLGVSWRDIIMKAADAAEEAESRQK